VDALKTTILSNLTPFPPKVLTAAAANALRAHADGCAAAAAGSAPALPLLGWTASAGLAVAVA
jgi:hypothetical protein